MNIIGQEGAQGIGSNLSKCAYISTMRLDFRQCDIRSEGAYLLCSSLQTCTNLTNLILDIRGNNIGSKGMQEFASALSKCQSIQVLQLLLACNDIQDEGLLQLGVALSKIQNLYDCSILVNQRDNIGIQGWINFCNTLQCSFKLFVLVLYADAIRFGRKSQLEKELRKVKRLVKFQVF
ncbi:hypothetical protein ABPG73_017064 [Tetrahymena malaccensis]